MIPRRWYTEIVLNDIEKIIEEFEILGLTPNSAKCEIFFNRSVSNSRKKVILEKLNRLLPEIKSLQKKTSH